MKRGDSHAEVRHHAKIKDQADTIFLATVKENSYEKILSVSLIIVMLLCIAPPCSAATTTTFGHNVSPVNPMPAPGSPIFFGTEAPTTGYNLQENMMYSFHGESRWSRLWLNKYLYGCTRYSVYINNKSDSPLTFTVRIGNNGTLDQTFILPARTDSQTYWGDQAMFFDVPSKDTLFCISFEAPSNFEGWVC